MAKSKAASAKRSPSVVALLIALMLTREERAIRLDLEALRGIANAKIKINGRYMREVAAALDSHKVLTYQIGKHELRSFLCVELFVILGNVCRTMRSLVIGMVFIYPAYQTHIKRHLTGIVRSNEHLCFFFPLR